MRFIPLLIFGCVKLCAQMVIPVALDDQWMDHVDRDADIYLEVSYYADPYGDPLIIEPAERVWWIQSNGFLMLGGTGADLPRDIMGRKTAWIHLAYMGERITTKPATISPRRDGLDMSLLNRGNLAKALKQVMGVDAVYLVQVVNYLAGNTSTLHINAQSYQVQGNTVIDANGDWVGGLGGNLLARIQVLESKTAALTVSGNDVIFDGVNLHIRSGTGATDGAVNGLGNLIVGYNEPRLDSPDQSGSHNIVVGKNHNYASYGGVVTGWKNSITAIYACVSGGRENVASGDYASVVGGAVNTASGFYSSISGGSLNETTGRWSSIAAGRENRAEFDHAAVAGGYNNTASGALSLVAGGDNNLAEGQVSFVSGGSSNEASGLRASVSGGSNNRASSVLCTVLGGTGIEGIANGTSVHTLTFLGIDAMFESTNVHIRSGSGATNGAVNGLGNLIVGYNEIGGGSPTRLGSHNLVVGSEHEYNSFGGMVAGLQNTISAPYASALGGFQNTASGQISSVLGGYLNTSAGVYSCVSGGRQNSASNDSCSVSGGQSNVASGDYSSICGGHSNQATGTRSVVAGGSENVSSGEIASIAGGRQNMASGQNTAILGGLQNASAGVYSCVSGGRQNSASNESSSVSGGQLNIASGTRASVSGGYQVEASSDYEWAGGSLVGKR